MALTGSLVNFIAIILGGGVGLLFRRGLPKKYMLAVLHVIGLVVITLGISYVLESKQILVIIISVILGTLIGTALGLEDRLKTLGDFLQNRIRLGGEHFSEGFTGATLLFCVGAMAITGSMQSGLAQDHTILYVKAVMDGIIALFMASTLGVGVLFSAVPVLVYQGVVTLLAVYLRSYLSPDLVAEMSAVGGVALLSLGLGMAEIKKMKTADMLPGIFLPPLVAPLVSLLLSKIP